ncbi:hypothetical protein GN234_23120 [Pseudomonas bijieensis]|uniref:Uncharacterized protein n=1 Tax=Pseudomonas bijieensis TaxID=2681983 RepID=A0A6N1CJK9_9PSED|nr:hypothetical protein GN234_23120 [Pseudomonas bijieensis]
MRPDVVGLTNGRLTNNAANMTGRPLSMGNDHPDRFQAADLAEQQVHDFIDGQVRRAAIGQPISPD